MAWLNLAESLLLGGLYMSAVRNVAEVLSRADRLGLCVNLLTSALEQIDLLGDYPDLGARLAEIIEVLRQQEHQLVGLSSYRVEFASESD